MTKGQKNLALEKVIMRCNYRGSRALRFSNWFSGSSISSVLRFHVPSFTSSSASRLLGFSTSRLLGSSASPLLGSSAPRLLGSSGTRLLGSLAPCFLPNCALTPFAYSHQSIHSAFDSLILSCIHFMVNHSSFHSILLYLFSLIFQFIIYFLVLDLCLFVGCFEFHFLVLCRC